MVTRRRPRRRWCDTLVPPISPPIGRTRSSYSRSRLTARLPRRAELLSGPTPPPRQEGRTRIIGSTGPPSPGCGVGFDPLVGLDTPAMTLAKTVTVGGPPAPRARPGSWGPWPGVPDRARRRPGRRWCDTLVPPISPPIGRTRSPYSRSRLTARLPRRAELLSGPTPPPHQRRRTGGGPTRSPPAPGMDLLRPAVNGAA